MAQIIVKYSIPTDLDGNVAKCVEFYEIRQGSTPGAVLHARRELMDSAKGIDVEGKVVAKGILDPNSEEVWGEPRFACALYRNEDAVYARACPKC